MKRDFDCEKTEKKPQTNPYSLTTPSNPNYIDTHNNKLTETSQDLFDFEFDKNKQLSPNYSKIMKPTANSRIHSHMNDNEVGPYCMKYNKSKLKLELHNNNYKRKKDESLNIIKLKNVINENGLNKIKQYLKEKGIL